jgi:hypothetical protein
MSVTIHVKSKSKKPKKKRISSTTVLLFLFTVAFLVALFAYDAGYWRWPPWNEENGNNHNGNNNYNDHIPNGGFTLAFIEYVSGAGLDAEQGVCTDGAYFYVSSTQKLSKFTMDGSFVDSVVATDDECGHCGDVSYYNGKIYAPVTNWPTATLGKIKVYDTNLNLLDVVVLPTSDWSGGAAGVSVDGNGIWICIYHKTFIVQCNMALQCIGKFDVAFTEAQGIKSFNGKLYVVTHAHTVYQLTKQDGSWMQTDLQNINAYEGIEIWSEYAFIGQGHTASNDPICKYTFSQQNK